MLILIVKKCNHIEVEQVTLRLRPICVREPGKIETAPTPVTEKQDYTHGDVKNVITRLQLTNFLKAIKLNLIHIRIKSTRLLLFRYRISLLIEVVCYRLQTSAVVKIILNLKIQS